MTLRSLFGRAASTLLMLSLAACGGGGGGDAATFTVGGTVSGLAAGTQIVLNNGGSDSLTVSANSTFVFSKTVPSNGSYLVTITTQPVGQTCSVANFQGAGVTANVTNVNVTCSAVTHTVGGSVSGLATGQQVTLNNNGADALVVNADGTFTFATPVAYNGSYAVTVGVQPTGQTCTVSNGSGSGVVANIADVAVTCSTNTFTISGAVTGLASGQQVTLNNNAGDPLTVAADGSFSFATPVAFNGSYAVTVGTQPTGQTCTVANGTGAGVTANVADVAVTCSTNTFTIGGTVGGLAAGQQVTVNNNGGNPLTVTANGSFTFTTPVSFNGSYAVTVGTQPTGQTCSVSNGTGAGVTADISNVSITCSTNTFTVGGTVSGLAAGQQVTLFNNGGNAKIVTANGAYTFSTPVNFNGSFAVTVNTQPTGQTCSVSNGSGSGVTANVSNVNISCSTNTYTIGGTVTGLAAGQQVTLFNNGGNAKIVTANGAYTFSTPVNFNGSYAVTVNTQPTGQTCSVSNGSGSGVTANVSNVNITCSTNTYTIGGTVSGLAAGQQVTLFDNGGGGGNTKIVTANGAYTFTTPVNYGGSYAVTVNTQPTGQTCSVSNGTGTNLSANVTNANITCSTNTYTIGGTVSGLEAGQQVTLFNNGGDAKIVTANGAFTFTTPVNYNGSYAVTVNTQPTGETCRITSGTGNNVAANVTGVSVSCRLPLAYVTNKTDNTVSQFKINLDGTLASIGAPVATGVTPNVVTVDPTGRFAYVANFGGNPGSGTEGTTVSQYLIDAATGVLTANGTATTGRSPYSIAIDPTGTYAYVTNQGDDTVSQFTINANGTLSPLGTPVNTGSKPYQVTVDPTGHYVYVANLASAGTAGGVSQYTISGTGTLVPMSTPLVTTTTAVNGLGGAIGVAINPAGTYAYVTNLFDQTITRFTFNGTGGLVPVVETAQPTGVTPYPMSISPDGQHAFWSNKSDYDIQPCTFAVSGQLACNGGDRLGAIDNEPQYMAVDPFGRYVYAVSYNAGGPSSVTQFAIGAGAGVTRLSPTSAATGNGSFSITTTR